ncbi:hypothetical protein JCM5350_002213 [Sporobolomyces pararoseus]
MATIRAPSPPPSPAPSTTSSIRTRNPPPKLPLPPLPGSRLSFNPSSSDTTRTIPITSGGTMSYSSAGSSSSHHDDEDDHLGGEEDSSYSSSTSTSPSSLTPTLPVTPKQDHKVLTFPSRSPPSSSSPSRPSTAPACPFPTTGKRNQIRRRRGTQEEEESEEEEGEGEGEEEDCGCGTPPTGFNDSEDELDVLDFVLKDQQLALRGTNSSSSRIAGETGLGLFKRPGIEGLSLSPSTEADGEPPALAPPTITIRRPSTAPASTNPTTLTPATTRSRTRKVSNFIPKLRLPKPGSSESDDSTTEEEGEARDSDETVPSTTLASRKRKSGRKKKTPKKPFDRFIMPSQEELMEARQCELVGETGVTVTLDELIKQRGRVVFVALRHFWCNLCQQYVQALREAMLSLVHFQNSVDNLSLTTGSSVSVGEYHEPRAIIPPLYIVLVSTGSHRLIPTYRQRLDCPFPLYVDRSRKLYKTLGMTKSSLGMGKDSEKGSYIKNSQWENVVNSTKNGLAMPRYPGPQAQLGGEFVFTHHKDDDSISCEYASRMHTTRAHAEIRDLFAAAGVQLNDQDAESVYGESTFSHAS